MGRVGEEVQTEEEYFDYYDGTDHYGEPDDEVSAFCSSMEIWIPLPEWRERDFKHMRANPGTYTVVLVVNGRELKEKALVLRDQWYDKTCWVSEE